MPHGCRRASLMHSPMMLIRWVLLLKPPMLQFAFIFGDLTHSNLMHARIVHIDRSAISATISRDKSTSRFTTTIFVHLCKRSFADLKECIYGQICWATEQADPGSLIFRGRRDPFEPQRTGRGWVEPSDRSRPRRSKRTTLSHTPTKMQFGNHINYP
jgi:hypothetical protein